MNQLRCSLLVVLCMAFVASAELDGNLRKERTLEATSPYMNPSPLQPGDLNVRFNKIPFPNGVPDDFDSLGAGDYPIRGSTADMLKNYSWVTAL